MDDNYDFVDNVFCTAILQILEIPGILSDSPSIDLDELKCDFEKNGNCDETFHENGPYLSNNIVKRKPLANLQSKMNKTLSKKAQKLAKTQNNNFCRFCENNQESVQVFSSHGLRDMMGRLTCPRLRKYVCPICGASGDNAHTVRYCTKKPIFVIKGGETTEIRKVRHNSPSGYTDDHNTLFKKTIRI